jgi:hypothetical protein
MMNLVPNVCFLLYAFRFFDKKDWTFVNLSGFRATAQKQGWPGSR